MDQTGRRPQDLCPKVIACGYRQVLTKAGNLFPAFLIRLPRLDTTHNFRTDKPLRGNNPHQYVWRTKRDFLLLNRSLMKTANRLTSLFPKKAFAKLCHHAMKENECNFGSSETFCYGPWVRPDDDESPDGGYCLLVDLKTDSQSKNDDHAESSLINNFRPEMKKSIHQLDCFLLSAYKAYLIDKSERTSECKQNLDSTQKHQENHGRSGVEILQTGMIEGWILFSRNEDSENLTNQTMEKLEEGRRSIATAARLGQYFASEENAKHVIDTARMLILDSNINYEKIAFLEPSCGDGRLINELLRTNDERTTPRCIIGCEIDPSAVEKARLNLQGTGVIVKCQDFLSTDKHQLFFGVLESERSSNLTGTEFPFKRRRRVIDDNNVDDGVTETTDDLKLVVIGGPPYTPKSLPEKFILHSIQTLNAEIVVFIVPERSRNEADRIKTVLNVNIAEGESRWCCECKDLGKSLFSFQDTIVSQPSILQYWWRK